MIALDASAMLAFLLGEQGQEKVEPVIDESVMSTVNLSEVLGRFSRQGHSAAAVLARLEQTRLRWSSFDAAQALIAAELLPLTRSLGLSLGDRACLALALSRNIPVMTADRAWEKLRLDVEIAIIR